MGVIRVCDWTKMRIKGGEETFKVVIGNQEFEVSEIGFAQLMQRLTTDVDSTPPRRQPDPVVEEANHDDPELLEETPEPSLEVAEPIPAPASIKERLPTPTQAQADRVIAESTRFPSGGLSTLSPGKHRNIAAKKLAAKEETFERNLKTQQERIQ